MNKIKRDGYIHNMISGLLNAFQSVIILMVLTRVLGIDAAGVFAIAYAVANLMLNIGKYGMRNFQATDVQLKYSSSEYFGSRLITTGIMIAACIVYTFYLSNTLNYTTDKTLIIVFMCIWKCVDSVEDVYQGEFQRAGRLDLGAKEFTYRQLISTLAFIIFGYLFHDLLIATVATALISIIAALILLMLAFKSYKCTSEENETFKKIKINKSVANLLLECFPLFISMFLSFYLANGPKYAIDTYMNSADQAKYGFIAMPVFVVGMLAQFLYRPILNDLAETFLNIQMNVFKKKVAKQVINVVLITIVVLIGGFLLGIPVLSFIYNTDLHSLKLEFMILLVGSGFNAYSNLMLTILTLMRYTKGTIIAYSLASLFLFMISGYAVKTAGLFGASCTLLFGMLILALCLTILYIVGIKRSLNMTVG